MFAQIFVLQVYMLQCVLRGSQQLEAPHRGRERSGSEVEERIADGGWDGSAKKRKGWGNILRAPFIMDPPLKEIVYLTALHAN